MNVIISYKNGKIKRIPNIQYTEFDMIMHRFYYWAFGSGEKPKEINITLVNEIKVNNCNDENGE